MAEAEHFDVVIVGGGPNGLTAAAYLQRAGASVVVLDKRFEWGGTLATDDYSTPFFYNLCQYRLPLGAQLPPYADLDLPGEGLRMLAPDPVTAFVPAGGGEALVVERDGKGLSGLESHIEAINDTLPAFYYVAPMAEDDVRERLGRRSAAKPAAELAQATPASLAQEAPDARGAALVCYVCAQLGFVDDAPLGLLGSAAFAGYFRPHLAMGGAKALADALFRAGARVGVQYRAVADVVRIERRGERLVAGCHDGREFEASTMISTLDPQSTFDELLDDGLVPEELRETARGWQHDDVGPFTAHFGIKGEAPAVADGHGQGALECVLGFEDATSVVEHLRAVRGGQAPAEPAGHVTVTSQHDPTQAAPGPYGPLHTLRFQTPAPHRHPGGEWDHHRAEYRAWCWDWMTGRVADLQHARPLFGFADAPEDIARRFRTTRAGTPRQGALVAGQALTNRPHPEASSCRTPIDGFYLGGGSVHPGIPGSLGGGYNAARVVCEDLGLTRWWNEPALMRHAREAGVLPERAEVAPA